MATQSLSNEQPSFDSLTAVGSGSRTRPINSSLLTRTVSLENTRVGSERISYRSRVKDQAITSSKPEITVTPFEDFTTQNAPTIRRKTWPSRNSSYKRKKGFFSFAQEESERVINIYIEHRDHLEADFRARTDLDTKNDTEDLYVPNQEAGGDWSSIPSTPFLKDEFNAGTTQGIEAFMNAFLNEASRGGTYKDDVNLNDNLLPFVVGTREVVW